MAPFSRAPLNLTIALFVAAFSKFWRSWRNFFPRWAWRACKSFDRTRGTIPMHPPPIPRLVWLSSFSLPGRVAKLSSHCSRCSAHPPPHPFLSSPPLTLPPLPPAPLLLLLTLRSAESLPLSLEGSLPSPGLPTNCYLHPIFDFCLLATVTTVFSSSRSACAMGRSGSCLRRGGRFPRAEAATTIPRTRAWQPM